MPGAALIRFFVAAFCLFFWSLWSCFGQIAADSGSNQSECQDTEVQLGGNPTASGGIAPYTYSWSPRAGLSCSNCANPQATPKTTTTYTLTVTDTEGNTAQDQVTVTINPNPVLIDAFGSSNFIQCNGADFLVTVFDSSVPANNTNYKITWGDGTPGFSGNSFPTSGIQHNYPSGKNYVLSYEITGANGCTSVRNYTVTNITNPGIGLEIPENTIGCGPKEICFPITGFENNDPTTVYHITFGDGADTAFTHPPPNQICHVYSKESCSSPGNAFVFKITASNNCDVSTAEVAPIKIFTPPQAKFSVIQGCLNEPNQFINETETGFNSSCQSNARYSWDFGDGTTESVLNKNPVSHVYTEPGDYIITLTSDNGECETTSFSDTVHIEEAAASSFEMDLTKECAPSGELRLTNTSSPPSNSPEAFEWSIEPEPGAVFRSTGTSTSTQINDIVDFAEQGDYTVTLKYTTICNEFISTEEVSIDQQLSISPDNILNVEPVNCLPFTLNTTTDLEIPDPGGYRWVLKGTGVVEQPSNANMQTPGQLELGPGNYTLELTVETKCGLSNTASKEFSVTEFPAVNAGEGLSVCESEGLVSLAGSPQGGSWTGPCTTPDGNFNPACAGAAASGHQLIYTYGSGSCQTRDTLMVEVIQAFQPDAGADRNFCINDPGFELLDQEVDPAGGSWSLNGAPVSVFDPVNRGTGEHQLVYSYTEPGAICAGTDIVIFTVIGAPEINPGPSRDFCINAPSFDLSTRQGATPAGGIWTVNGLETNMFNPIEQGPGTHEITYSFADPNGGCAGQQEIQFRVNTLPQVNAGSPQTLCIDDPAYNLTAAQNATPAGGNWNINGVPGDVLIPANLGAGVHQLEYVYMDPVTQCPANGTVELTIVDLEDVQAGSDMAVCLGEGMIDLSQKGDISRAGGEWSGPGVVNGMFDPQVTDIGIFEVFYTITDPNSSCATSDAVNISVYDTPQVRAGWDVTLCSISEGYTFRAHSPKGGTWDGPGILDASEGIFSPFLSGEGNHVVRYTYTNQFGCSKTDSLTVTVCTDPQDAVQIPNAFTPNGDQLNDTFAPVMETTTDVYKFQIADRSNQIVFESNQPDERWDGTYNGMEMQGVFAYRLFVRFTSGLEVSREGEVLVIR